MSFEKSETHRTILFIILPYILSRREAKNSKLRCFEAFPYGLLSVASHVKKKATRPLDIKVLDCNLYSHDEYVNAIIDILKNFNPDIVGLSMMFDNSYKYLDGIARTIKDYRKDLLVVVGGAAASVSWNEIVSEQERIDAVCYAEGELPFERLVNSENMLELLENDPSWITNKSMAVGKNPVASFIDDLSDAVHIDYSMVDSCEYKMREAFSPFLRADIENNKQYFMVSSRGCPYKCVFCSNASIHGKRIRYADIDSIISHVESLVADYGMNVLTIYDDQLLSNVKRAKNIFRQLAKYKLRIECPNGLSVAFIDEELVILMKKAGVDTVALAIESGSEYMIRNVIHKPLKLEMVKPVVQLLKKEGFFVEGFFVTGLPGETDEYRLETLKFIKEIELDWSGFSLAVTLRGSPLYDICVTNGYISKNLRIGEVESDKYIIRVPGIDPDYITRATYLMNLDVNFVNNNRMKTGDYRVAANCFKDVIRRYDNHAFAYYYLAKAQEQINSDSEQANANMSKFQSIINSDPTWKEYFEYFNL